MTPPRVLVSGAAHRCGDSDIFGVGAAYVRSLTAHGIAAVTSAPNTPTDQAAALLEGMAGLVLTGGEDIDPAFYGAAPSDKLEAINRQRDHAELALLRAARTAGIPVLAICRGTQLVNVALGGTLWQDLPSERDTQVAHAPEAPRGQRVHPVRIAPDSRLHSALGVVTLEVNSTHHQGVRDLAHGLAASAWSSDGLVEAIEATDGGWLLGVQWHPEDLADADPQAPDHGIFRAFAAALSVPRPAA